MQIEERKSSAEDIDVVIVGAGETASIAAELISENNIANIVGFVAEKTTVEVFDDESVHSLGDIEKEFPVTETYVFVAISSVWLNRERARIFKYLAALGYRFLNIVDRSARIAPSASLGRNLLLNRGSIVGTKCRIGDGTFISEGGTVSHSSDVGQFCYLSAGCVLGGFSSLGDQSFVGLGSVISDRAQLSGPSILGAASYLPAGTWPAGVYRGAPANCEDIQAEDFLRLRAGQI